MTDESNSEWFLKDKAGITGPLSETTMREHVDRTTDSELMIRQGNSDWRSVDVIRTKIRQLEENGIFVRYKNVAEGPFTLTRAHHVLKLMTPGGIDVRTGAKGSWIPADKWLSKIDELLAVESKEMDSLSIAVQHVLGRKGFGSPPQHSDELGILPDDEDTKPAQPESAVKPEQPRWLAVDNASDPEPVMDAEVIQSPAQHASNINRHTEPVIEVVKVMNHAETVSRDEQNRKSAAKPAGQLPSSEEAPQQKNTATPSTIRPIDTSAAIRVRPRNLTSQKNRTSTGRNRLLIIGTAASIVCLLSYGIWNWLATPDSTAARTADSNGKSDPVQGVAADQGIAADTSQDKDTRDPETEIGDLDSPQNANSDDSSVNPDEPVVKPDNKGNPPSTAEGTSGIANRQNQSDKKPLVISTGMLFRPRFGTSEGEVNAGTAFAAKLTGKSQTLIITALNLFGPAGGLNTEINADRLATAWKKLIVEDCKSQNYFGEIEMQPVSLTDAQPHPKKSGLGDIAACTVIDATAIEALPLSQRIPATGERVWLVSKLPGVRELLHPATVERLADGWLRYTFTDRNISLKSTNGAPIVDHLGKVVAVHAGSGKKDGKTIGSATPVINFYPTLAAQVQ